MSALGLLWSLRYVGYLRIDIDKIQSRLTSTIHGAPRELAWDPILKVKCDIGWIGGAAAHAPFADCCRGGRSTDFPPAKLSSKAEPFSSEWQ